VKYILETDYKKVAKEIEKYLKWKKIDYKIKNYSRPKMIKFKLGFMKSIVIAQIGRNTYVKIPSPEFCDVLAQFKTKAVFGKIMDKEGVEIEKELLNAQIDAAKKTLILIVVLTVGVTPAMILKNLPPYNLILLLFSFLPVKVKVPEFNMEINAFPILYPYYLIRKKKLNKT